MTDIQTGAQILRRHNLRLLDAGAFDHDQYVDFQERINSVQYDLEDYAEAVDEDVSEEIVVDPDGGIEIPPGKVLKFVFEVSHAPYYVMQLDNGMYVGCMAKVEYNDDEEPKPFVPPPEKMREHLESDHVQAVILDKENSPFGARD